MPRVFIPVPMRDLTGGVAEIAVEGQTVRQAIAAADARFPGLAGRLLAGGGLAPGLALAVDGIVPPLGLLAALRPDSELHFLPAIGGG